MARSGTKLQHSTRLTINLSNSVYQAFDEYCDKMGQTKTLALERILRDYLKRQTFVSLDSVSHI